VAACGALTVGIVAGCGGSSGSSQAGSAADVGKAAVPGEGHLHFTMDGGRYDFPRYSGANGALAVTLGVQGRYSPSVTPGITYRGLPPGRHTLVVHLANNDHTDVGPTATTMFTLGPSSPAPRTIAMGEYFYRPSTTTMRVGEPVTFVNDGRI
jgi:hypothetical protein